MTKNPMKNLPASAPDTVDVVAESNYGTTSEAYNKAFRTWRSSEKNEYAFRCRKRTKEAVYVEGKGYHEPDPAAEERRAIMQINMVIGMALFAFLLIENLLTALLMGAAPGHRTGRGILLQRRHGLRQPDRCISHSDAENHSEISGADLDFPADFPGCHGVWHFI